MDLAMNETEAERIALAVNVLRPDWPVQSLRTLLARPQLASKPRRDVAVALAWIACESESQTPARILEAGPWWQAVAVESGRGITRYPPKRAEDCPKHVGEWPEACRGCASEALAPDDQPYGDVRPASVGDVRAQLQMARGGLCSHGVSPDHCLQDHPTDQPAEEAS